MSEKSKPVLTSDSLIATVSNAFDDCKKVAIQNLSLAINMVVTCKETISQLEGERNILQQKNDVLESQIRSKATDSGGSETVQIGESTST